MRGAGGARLTEGDIVDGRFRIVREIGRGGMGTVFEATNIKLGKTVAIKILSKDLANRAGAVKRFIREAQAASTIAHRNVVDIHDFGEAEDGLLYYVMEYLRGRDLAGLLAAEGRLPWARARSILLQSVRAIKAAHDAKIIHRDIKPANVFLVDASEDEPNGVVKVLDFGIAKTDQLTTNTALTGFGDIMGTAWYMAPEIAQGKPADMRSDVYAMGILIYQVLAGEVPFGGSDQLQVLVRHANEQPRPLRKLAPNLPEPVHNVVMRCLAKEPDLRYQTMRALEYALSSIGLRGEPVDPSTKPPPQANGEPIPPPLIRPPPVIPPTMALPNGGLPASASRPPPGPQPPATIAPPDATALLEGGGLPDRVPETMVLEDLATRPKSDEPPGTQLLPQLAPMPQADESGTQVIDAVEEAPTRLLMPGSPMPVEDRSTKVVGTGRGRKKQSARSRVRKLDRQRKRSERLPAVDPGESAVVPAPPVEAVVPVPSAAVPSAAMLRAAPSQPLPEDVVDAAGFALPGGTQPSPSYTEPDVNAPPRHTGGFPQPNMQPTVPGNYRADPMRRWLVLAALAAAAAVGLGGLVAVIVTDRAKSTTGRVHPPAAAQTVHDR